MSGISESELFAGYRSAAGYAAQCGCGTWITAPSSSSTAEIAMAVLVHNESTDHAQWSAEQEAVALLRRLPVHVCRCHEHMVG